MDEQKFDLNRLIEKTLVVAALFHTWTDGILRLVAAWRLQGRVCVVTTNWRYTCVCTEPSCTRTPADPHAHVKHNCGFCARELRAAEGSELLFLLINSEITHLFALVTGYSRLDS